jgi:hypothetical protein
LEIVYNLWGGDVMKLYALCCVTVLGMFIYGGQGNEPVLKEVFNEIQIEESINTDFENLYA